MSVCLFSGHSQLIRGAFVPVPERTLGDMLGFVRLEHARTHGVA